MIETNSCKIIERLRKDGYELVTVRGSHHKYRRGERVVIVPHPKKDLPLGTARNIARQAGWI
jgi:predicted RNA binding protein YcfA (HicA-like mRNA interferase family)